MLLKANQLKVSNAMDDEYIQKQKIFYPYLLKSVERMEDKNLQLVQYTSADAAMSIIRNKEVWLRNVQCMNDYSEVEHGFDCLLRAFRSEDEGEKFKDTLEKIFPGIIDELIAIFDSRLPALRAHTYITCVSEHPVDEDQYGRLSMWRAYGGTSPVAVVMNRQAFRCETDILASYAHPVAYMSYVDFTKEFSDLTDRINKESDYVEQLGKDLVRDHLFELFKTIALCVKHPGFIEEREWRVIHNPTLLASQHVKSSIESINGVPQKVFKIPLANIPEHGLVGVEIPELIERIIIGPTDHQAVLYDTFVNLLREAGCGDADKKVFICGIPLRTN